MTLFVYGEVLYLVCSPDVTSTPSKLFRIQFYLFDLTFFLNWMLRFFPGSVSRETCWFDQMKRLTWTHYSDWF